MSGDETDSRIYVGLVLTHREKVILVKDQEGLWGLPAGRVKLEQLHEATLREANEETGLDTDHMIVHEQEHNLVFNVRPNYTSLGLILFATYHGSIPNSEWAVNDPGGDIIGAKAHDRTEVTRLVDSKELRKLDYNLAPLVSWILEKLDNPNFKYHHLPKIRSWAKRHSLAKDIPGLNYDPLLGRLAFRWPLEEFLRQKNAAIPSRIKGY